LTGGTVTGALKNFHPVLSFPYSASMSGTTNPMCREPGWFGCASAFDDGGDGGVKYKRSLIVAALASPPDGGVSSTSVAEAFLYPVSLSTHAPLRLTGADAVKPKLSTKNRLVPSRFRVTTFTWLMTGMMLSRQLSADFFQGGIESPRQRCSMSSAV